MANRNTATINPKALLWVRNAIGMPREIAAKKIGISDSRLGEYEAGTASPTIRQLRIAAKVYRRPTAFFYLQVLPEPPERINDFRSLPDEYEHEFPDLLDAVEAARARRINALELANVLGHEIPEFDISVSLDDDPAMVAELIRKRLGITFTEQASWRDKYQILRNWIRLVESTGVLVSQFSGVSVSVARGFSLSLKPFPLAALNGKDSPRAKIFTLFHELTHIALGQEGLCDLHEEDHTRSIEPFCNQVAAEILVPTSNLLNNKLVNSHIGTDWNDFEISEIAKTFGVSREVILRRLFSQNLITQRIYKQKIFALREEYEQSQGQSGGFMEYYRRVLRDNGVEFTRLVLSAYSIDQVTPTEVSRLLGGVKLKHVASIEHELLNRAS